MRVILITYNTPSSENIRGASALPYHLLKERGQGVDVSIFSFNANGLSNEDIVGVEIVLRLSITVLPRPKWLLWLMSLHLLFLRLFLKYPLYNYIRLTTAQIEKVEALNPDMIWVYGEELSRIAKQFPMYRRIHLGPDTESLYYYRMMGCRFVMNNAIDYWKCALMYRKYARMEREFPIDDNYTYLAVGEADVRHLQQLNPKVKAKFLRHPHYEVNSQFTIHNSQFHQPKIKLLIAGQYNLYMQQEADLLNEEFRVKSEELAAHYCITFLGKGWEKHVDTLRNAGWEVNHITFAPDYIEEICKHDIQVTPIAIGTGTKGKVLDALANGLLVIGTRYAMENIAVEHGVSCIEYRSPEEVTVVLLDIVVHTSRYEEMALQGQESVLKNHDRQSLARELFSLK